jgi:hypothetical protein
MHYSARALSSKQLGESLTMGKIETDKPKTARPLLSGSLQARQPGQL